MSATGTSAVVDTDWAALAAELATDPAVAGGAVTRATFERCGRAGIQGRCVAPEHGGSGAPLSEGIWALATLAGSLPVGVVFALGAQMWTAQVSIERFGSAEQRRHLDGLCRGQLIAAQATTEPGAGSDAFSMTTAAEPTARGWRLNGTKSFVSNGTLADLLVVLSEVRTGAGRRTFGAFLVPAGTAGLGVEATRHAAGLGRSPLATLTFDDVELPDDAIIGQPGDGLAIFLTTMGIERAAIVAGVLGRAQAVVADATAGSRRPPPQVADLAVQVRTTSWLLDRWCACVGTRRSRSLGSMVKLAASDELAGPVAALASTLGATGMLVGTDADLVLEIAGSRLYSGSSEVQRDLLARGLGLP